MVGTGLKKLAKENGMRVDKGVAYGDFKGYATTFYEGAGYKRMIVATTFEDPQGQFHLETLLNGKNLMKEFRLQEVVFSPKCILFHFYDNPGTMKKMEAFFDWFFPLLDENGATKSNVCVECGCEVEAGQWKLIDSAAYYMHTACANKVAAEIAQEEDTRKATEPGSYFGGFLGALIGATIGAVVWAVVLSFGYIASLVGLLIGWLADKGYHLLRGKNGQGKIAILIVTVVFGVLLGTLLSESIMLFQMIQNNELEGFVYGDIPWLLMVLITDVEYVGVILSNIGTGLLFAGLGVFAQLRRANKEVSDIKISDLK